MRRPTLILALLLACSGCATTARVPAESSTSAGNPAVSAPCTPPAVRDAPGDWCALPDEVRAFVDDRDTCDRFRHEPWPAGDSDADRMRRREILDGIRTACGGMDARLAELEARHASNGAVAAVLATFEATIER